MREILNHQKNKNVGFLTGNNNISDTWLNIDGSGET